MERYADKFSIKISISDTGIGIHEDQINKICDKFHRVPHPNKKTFPGTGLGLSIVKQFIDEMGGHISVINELGKGTCFELALQYIIAGNEKTQNPVKLKATNAMPEKILLVEDDYISRRIATMLLKHHFKTQIDEAPATKTAIELGRKYNYSQVITDIRLRVITGPELASKLTCDEISQTWNKHI